MSEWRTKSVEDFLKAVYLLQLQHGDKVSTKSLAEMLNITPPSVNDMIKRLSSEDMGALLEHEPYKGVQLSEQGRQIALQVIRRHRLLELFLHEILDYSWDEVHDEAERLEHAMSDRLEERIAAVLGDPQYDPHGDPIPDADGVIIARDLVPLAVLDAGHKTVVKRIIDQSEESLRHLAELGLVPDTQVEIIERSIPNDTVMILVGDAAQTISTKLAGKLMVARVG